MISCTVDSTACLLLTAPPDFSAAGVVVEWRRRMAREQGRGGHEERRALTGESVATLKYTATLWDDAATDFRQALRDYAGQPILAPFWPGECLLSDLPATPWAGGLRLFFEPEFTAYEVALASASAPSSFSPSSQCAVAPLCWCQFAKLPEPSAVSGATMSVPLELVETGSGAYAVGARSDLAATYGPALHGVARPILPALADWTTRPKIGGVEMVFDRAAVGYVRTPVENLAPQTPRRRLALHLSYTPAHSAQLLALWRGVAGPVGGWWCESGYAEASLAADATAASTVVTVDHGDAFSGESHLAFIDAAGQLIPRCIVSRVGNQLTLDLSPGNLATDSVRLSPLLFVRSAGDTLRLTYKSGYAVAESDIEVVELPTEVSPPAGETFGTTLGPLPQKWWGYVVADSGATWRFTSHDLAINAGALGTFTPRPIEHGDITMELNLERHDVDLTLAYWPGSPFEAFRTDLRHPALTVQILEGTIADPGAAQVIFSGRTQNPKFSGEKCTLTLAGPTALLDQSGPVQLVGLRCWAPLFSAPCGLSRSAHALAVDLLGIDSAGHPLFVDVGSGTFTGSPAHYSHGYAELTCADGSVRRLWIMSAAIGVADGKNVCACSIGYAVTLPDPVPTSGWALVAGCDKSFGRCQALANSANFRGMPHLPKTNPCMVAVTQSTSSGSKK